MKLTSAALVAAAVAAAAASDLRIITYNIRQATNRPGRNEMHWKYRRPMLTQQLKDESNDNTIMCFQEAFYHVVQDISEDLGDQWSWVGKGRDDGDKKGEFSPIFYRNEVWDLEANHTVWLSKTPDRPSRDWDADFNRIVTVADLRNKDSGDKITFMCTHFEWSGKTAQEHSAEIIVDLVASYNGHPLFVAGDLNSEPTDKPYKTMVTALTDLRTWRTANHRVIGSRPSLEKPLSEPSFENMLTYTGFAGDERNMLLDYVFVKDPASLVSSRYSVGCNTNEDGQYISDHRPVFVDLQLR